MINPVHYKTLLIENDIKKIEINSKHDVSSKSNEYQNEIPGISNNKLSHENIHKKRNVLKHQILKESNENHSHSSLQFNKNPSHNNYINITEDYKFESQKNQQNDRNNLSYTNFSLLQQSEERKLNSIQIHVTRNVDPKEKKQSSELDLRSNKHETYSQGKFVIHLS